MRGEYYPTMTSGQIPTELPPHARRILTTLDNESALLGTTSACAENTSDHDLRSLNRGNYLRMRGEYHLMEYRKALLSELPPHARRIHRCYAGDRMILGTTSACAENTDSINTMPVIGGNYLRMRGEYGVFITQGKLSLELPPHARRILALDQITRKNQGTTSACAENTSTYATPGAPTRNYLRMRGEYFDKPQGDEGLGELPPHARRIPSSWRIISMMEGTTSACAENTPHPGLNCFQHGNYLRMRGEYM